MPPTDDRPLERIVDVLIEHRGDLFSTAELRVLTEALARAPDPRPAARLQEELLWGLFRRGEEAG